MARASVALVWLLAGPLTAHAVTVTWEAQGYVESSDLDADFFAKFMPGLTGTQAGDELILRVTFDTGAPPIGQREFPDGGQSFSFHGSSLLLALEVPDLGTHVFRIDDDAPSGIHSNIVIFDDAVLAPEPARDGLVFRHAYLAPEGEIDFTVVASFFTTDTTLLDGAHLPLAPDLPIADGVTREISITDPRSASGGLLGIFFSLVRVDLPEAGTLGLLSLGLLALGALQRRRIPP